MYCNNCGKEIADGSKFCPECGQKMGGPINTVSKRYMIFSIIGFALALDSILDFMILCAMGNAEIYLSVSYYTFLFIAIAGSIASVTLSIVGLKAKKKAFAIFGTIIGSIFLILNMLMQFKRE